MICPSRYDVPYLNTRSWNPLYFYNTIANAVNDSCQTRFKNYVSYHYLVSFVLYMITSNAISNRNVRDECRINKKNNASFSSHLRIRVSYSVHLPCGKLSFPCDNPRKSHSVILYALTLIDNSISASEEIDRLAD